MPRLFRRDDRGFSFVELLAYIAIAALLILAALPQYSAYRERAALSVLQDDVRSAALAAEASNIDGGDSFETTIRAVGAIRVSLEGTTMVTSDLGSGDYRIVGTSPRTSRVVTYVSRTDGPLHAGLHVSMPSTDQAGPPASNACEASDAARVVCPYLAFQATDTYVDAVVATFRLSWLHNQAANGSARAQAELVTYEPKANALLEASSAAAPSLAGLPADLDSVTQLLRAYGAIAGAAEAGQDSWVTGGSFDEARARADLLGQGQRIAALVAAFSAGRVG